MRRVLVTVQVLTVQDTAGMWIVVAALAGLAMLLMGIAYVKPAWDVDVWHTQVSSKSMRSLASALPQGLDSGGGSDLARQSSRVG